MEMKRVWLTCCCRARRTGPGGVSRRGGHWRLPPGKQGSNRAVESCTLSRSAWGFAFWASVSLAHCWGSWSWFVAIHQAIGPGAQ